MEDQMVPNYSFYIHENDQNQYEYEVGNTALVVSVFLILALYFIMKIVEN